MLVSKTNALTTWPYSTNQVLKLSTQNLQSLLFHFDFIFTFVDLDRLELSTLHLSGVCSNQLNYRSHQFVLILKQTDRILFFRFPRATKIKHSKFLTQFQRFINDPLLTVIVPDFSVT